MITPGFSTNDKNSFGCGWLAASPDTSATAPNASWAGHIFGLIGQGDTTQPTPGNKAWSYTTDALTANSKYSLIVDILPYD